MGAMGLAHSAKDAKASVEWSRRFGWINFFMTASMNAVLASSNVEPNSCLRFQDLNRKYVDITLQKDL